MSVYIYNFITSKIFDKYGEKFEKNTVEFFRRIFGGKDKRSAEWRLQLYNALSGKNHTNPDDLRITTLENVIYIHMKNDISFLVDSQMSLYEHQSTWNLNMPLRGLFYFAKLYQKYLADIKEDIHLKYVNFLKKCIQQKVHI